MRFCTIPPLLNSFTFEPRLWFSKKKRNKMAPKKILIPKQWSWGFRVKREISMWWWSIWKLLDSSIANTNHYVLLWIGVVVKIWPAQNEDTCPNNQKPPSLQSHSRSNSPPRGGFLLESSNTLSHSGAPPILETSVPHKITSTTDHLWSPTSITPR